MKKSILSLFLVMLMTVCFTPVSAMASSVFDQTGYCGPIEDQESVEYKFTYSDDNQSRLEIKERDGATGPIALKPWNGIMKQSTRYLHIYTGVTAICDDCFKGFTSLNGCNIFHTVNGPSKSQIKRIGKRAFEGCENFGDAAFYGLINPTDNLEEIDDYAFGDCDSLPSTITLPDNVTTIGYGVFSDCENIRTLTLSNNIKHIPNSLIYNCPNLEKINLPANLETIGYWPFQSCPKLTQVNISANNQYFSTEDGVLFNKEKTILIACPNSKENYTVPATVTTIREHAFEGCTKLKSITFPENSSLQTIGDDAFSRCSSLETIALPDSVTNIGKGAFCDCDALENIGIPSGVTEIQNQTFTDCDLLNSIVVPSDVTTVGLYSFSDCPKLSTVTFLGSAPTINAYAFSNTTTTAHFPAADESWTDSVLQNYGGCITWVADNPVDLSSCLIDQIPALTYTVTEIKPELDVTLGSKSLVKDKDYTVSYENNTNVGTAKVIITGMFRYTGSAETTFEIVPLAVTVPSAKTLTFNGKIQAGVLEGDYYTITGNRAKNAGSYVATLSLGDKNNMTWSDGTVDDKTVKWTIKKAANPLKISGKTANIKYSTLKKKAQTLAVTKVIKFTKDAKDKKTYTLSSAKNGSKSFKKYFKINKTTGKVTVKKGLKKGTYKVVVKVKAAGNANYKASTVKTVTFTVKVK